MSEAMAAVEETFRQQALGTCRYARPSASTAALPAYIGGTMDAVLRDMGKYYPARSRPCVLEGTQPVLRKPVDSV